MTRDEGYQIVTTLIKNPNLIKHHLATEAVMRALARRFKEINPGADIDEEKWGLVGLLHDADYELTKGEPKKHTVVTEEKIGKLVEPDVMYAIKAHAYKYNANGVEPKSLMDWSMYCSDELTGIIIAATLIHPEKKIGFLSKEFVLNRFKEKAFARSANRDQVLMCESKLNIPLIDFIDLALKAMQSISKELGL